MKSLLEQCKTPEATLKDDVSSEDWSGAFEWDSLADDARFNIFGISSYRANQREVSILQLKLNNVIIVLYSSYQSALSKYCSLPYQRRLLIVKLSCSYLVYLYHLPDCKCCHEWKRCFGYNGCRWG